MRTTDRRAGGERAVSDMQDYLRHLIARQYRQMEHDLIFGARRPRADPPPYRYAGDAIASPA